MLFNSPVKHNADNKTIDLRDLQYTQILRNDISYNYAGLTVGAAIGVHESAFSIVESLHLKKDTQILVLGAGAGAFDQRLLDNGFSNITAIEFVRKTYKVSGTKLYDLDLNQNFSHLGKYELIVALEIIEHLENQFHFIREIKKSLTITGHLILSSPHVESSFARVKYFLLGKLHFFSYEELYWTGHINPIFRHILDFNLAQSGLKILKVLGNNQTMWFDLIFKYPIFSMRFVYIFAYLISMLEFKKGKEHNQNINIFLIGHQN